MISQQRSAFNQAFTEGKYQNFLDEIEKSVNYRAPFKIAETPVFVPKTLTDQLVQACADLSEVICQPGFKEMSQPSVLPDYLVPNETEHTAFLSVDFGICQDEEGNISPQLIEMQGFPSLFFYQHICAMAYRHHFDIPENLNHLFGGHTAETYTQTLREIIIGEAQPENVVLIDIEPKKQNTQIDFWATEKALGIKVLCVSELKVDGRDVYYIGENGRKIGVVSGEICLPGWTAMRWERWRC